jgi:protein involved in polysaccharide export with SLBB domain
MIACTICRVIRHELRVTAFIAGCLLLFLGSIGCQGPSARAISSEDQKPTPLFLAPGDAIEVTFPGATNLSGTHRIGPEGTITMPLVGQVQAAGKTVPELQSDLAKLYEHELRQKEVIVAMIGSANSIYVTGAVLRPGRVQMERPLTALEAVMEAGGFTETANKKKVSVVRYEGETNSIYILNLDPILSGGHVPPFYLKPRDIVDVPQKVQWF